MEVQENLSNTSRESEEILSYETDEKLSSPSMEPFAWDHKPLTSSRSRNLRFVFMAGIACSALGAFWSMTQPGSLLRRPSSLPPLPPPKVVYFPEFAVGPREYQRLYKGQCTSDEFLHSLKMATLRSDGASRHADVDQSYETSDLPPFEYSFDLATGCGTPHVFTPAEACDLLSSFGGILIQGDSYMRHVINALFMLLRGKISGATFDVENNHDCIGNKMFNDKVLCRDRMVANSRDDPSEPTCGGAFDIVYVGGFSAADATASLVSLGPWAAARSPASRLRSPILFAGFGIHSAFDWESLGVWFNAIPMLERDLLPKALNVFAGIHHPGPNQPEQYKHIQGPQMSGPFNENLEQFTLLQPPLIQGGFKTIHYWNITDGAESYDGVHYAYQVNMEKVQLFLNLLDIAWTDLVENGGLISTSPPSTTSLGRGRNANDPMTPPPASK